MKLLNRDQCRTPGNPLGVIIFWIINFVYVADRSHGRYSAVVNCGLAGLGFCFAMGRENKVDGLTMWPPAMVNSQTLLPRLTLPG